MKLTLLRPTQLIKVIIREKRMILIGTSLILVVLVGLLGIKISQNDTAIKDTASAGHNQYLLSQVDTDTGEPRSGRDPASQQQTSLASVSSSQTGTGQTVTKPASGVAEDHSRHVGYSDVYADPNKTGIATSGCYIDYGIPGDQCVPSHIAIDGALTCSGVRKHFPNGVKLSGTDRFNLDTNLDKVACGSGD